MPALSPQLRKVSDIKAKLLQPALTSHFQCTFNIPETVKKQLGFNNIGGDINDTLMISCSEASLPGSSLATHELNNDFTGVTQKHAYRRLYDDRADFTFYVDNQYSQIRIFEGWIRYIAGEQLSFGEANNVSYRVNYPKNYKTNIYISKFERNFGKGNAMDYTFVNAFPIAVNSMPVSYDTSSLLKCTVSFSYDRYFAGNVQVQSEPYSLGGGVPRQFETKDYITAGNLNIAPNQNNLSANFNPERGPIGESTQAAQQASTLSNIGGL